MNYFQKLSQEVNKVYKTNDLSIFKTIEGNRPPNPQHIKRLSASIKENGFLCNPILVNEKMQVIDGQHRLLASKKTKTSIYYIVLDGYNLNEVHTLNLNQKNWQKKDFMEGYAEMGIEPYVKLKEFYKRNKDFTFNDCIAMCSNITGSNYSLAQKYYENKASISTGYQNIKEVFEEGTWKGRDFELAQKNANKIRLIQPYYKNYNRSVFVGAMLGLLTKSDFDFNEFMHKLRLQPTALLDCVNREQYKSLIEDIYNYRSRNKVNLRY
jgi:hypothetical protein